MLQFFLCSLLGCQAGKRTAPRRKENDRDRFDAATGVVRATICAITVAALRRVEFHFVAELVVPCTELVDNGLNSCWIKDQLGNDRTILLFE